VQGTGQGTTTNIDGQYSLNVPSAASVLEFRFIGYNTETVTVGNQTIINIQLAEDIEQLGEVVVTAFGIEREKKALSYSVQEVEGTKIQEAGTPNTVNALQGKVAGVQVNQSSGMPGSSSLIRVRGSNSLTGNNQPLFVVDGMPIESTASTSGGVSGVDYSSRSLDINPNDIASISVLKGPTAAALYGLRASNGVVLITTKSGKNLNRKAQVTFSQDYMVDRVSRLPDLQSTYAQGSGGNFSRTASTSWGPRITNLADPAVNPFATGNGTYINNVGEEVTPQVYDNVDPLFQTGHLSTTNLDIAGAGDAASYAFGVGYTDQNGVIPTTGMERINMKIRGEFNVTDKLTSGASANFVNTSIDKLAGGSNLSNVLFTTYWAPRSYDLWGTPFATEENPYRQIHYRGTMDNPRWSLANNEFGEEVTRVFGNAFLNYKPFEWLTANYRIGTDAFTENRKEVYELGSGFTGGRGTAIPSGGQIYDAKYLYRQVNSNLNLTFDKQFGNFRTNLLVGNEIININTDFQSTTGTGITIGGFRNMSNTTNQQVANSILNTRTVGFFANATIDYKDFLFLTASGRQDYVSNMPRDNRTFFYPSIGLGLVVSDMLDFSSSSPVSFLKLRGSYAEVGQAGPAYSTQIPFVGAGVATGFTNDGIEFPFNEVTAFQLSNTLFSPDLVPQNTVTWEAGFQVQLYKNRVGLDVNYFNASTVDQIFAVPVAPSSGYTSELRNAGELNSDGWEITLNATPLSGGQDGFTWDFTANITSIDNEVVSLADGVDNIFLGGFTEPNIRAQAGSQYPIIFGSRYLRDDAGNIVVDSRQFIDGVVNPDYGMPIADPELGEIGQVNPDFILGFNNSFSYKGITLSAQVDWQSGGQAYAGNTRLQKLYGMDIVTEDRETPVVLDATKGYIDDDGNFINEGNNDIAIQKGQRYWNTVLDAIDESNVYSTSFVRLREARISYNLPTSIFNGGFIRNASVYLLGRNLALRTDYPNFDPETSVGGASNFQGLEYVNLPQTRSFGGGIKVTF
jgi:TonB-linked SusC/RagA family outer membrane protein